jgi:hypothetical protein
MPGKDRESEHVTPDDRPLLPPSVGSSAHPASTLASVWSFLLPALDHIMRSSLCKGMPGVIAAEYHVLCHTYVYDFCVTQNHAPEADVATHSGGDIYTRLDEYLRGVAQDVFRALPMDDSIVHHLVPAFERYTAGAQSVHRLLNYLNRHFVKRMSEEDSGWLRIEDAFQGPVPSMLSALGRATVTLRMQEHRAEELRKWGYCDGGPPGEAALAEARAEAGSSPDRIVPLLSLAHRRFRTEVVEPLLAVPKQKGGKKRRVATSNSKSAPPKGRLARAVKVLLESKTDDEYQRQRLVAGLGICLTRIGVRPNHPLHERLSTFLAKRP